MAEYPPHSCGKCPFLGKFEAIAKEQGDFLARRTVPTPQVELKSKTTLHEDLIGVPASYHAPNLSVPPISERFYGLQASNQQLGIVGAGHTPYNIESSSKFAQRITGTANVNTYNDNSGVGTTGNADIGNVNTGNGGFGSNGILNNRQSDLPQLRGILKNRQSGPQINRNGNRIPGNGIPVSNDESANVFKTFASKERNCCPCITSLPVSKPGAKLLPCCPSYSTCPPLPCCPPSSGARTGDRHSGGSSHCLPTCCPTNANKPDSCCHFQKSSKLKVAQEPCPPSPYNLNQPCPDGTSRNTNGFLAGNGFPASNGFAKGNEFAGGTQQLGVVGARHTPYDSLLTNGGLPVNINGGVPVNEDKSRTGIEIRLSENGGLQNGAIQNVLQQQNAMLQQNMMMDQNGNYPQLSAQQLGVVGASHTTYTSGLTPSGQEIPTRDVGDGNSGPQPLKMLNSQELKGILKNESLGQKPCPCEQMAYTAGRLPPGVTDPSALVPVPNDLRPLPFGDGACADGGPGERAPCYLPQPEDKIPVDLEKNQMGPIGPWATGRVDWSPLAGLTGTRPVVDKYSIARFSEGEWRKHNKDMLDMSGTEQHKANLIEWNGRQCLEQTRADVDKNQQDNTRRLWQRAADVHRWKCELERAIAAAAEEIGLMEEERRRLKSASSVLMLPESIAGECLERRTGRLDPELVRDVVEDELIKELALTAELRETFYRTLKDVEMQLLEDKTAKQRLEYDWSDKKEAHEVEAINVALNNNSTVLMFKPGATIFPDEQSTEEYWEHFTRETLQEAESTRQRSVALRGTLDAILINAARDLRSQADRVDLALSKRIACTEEIRIRLENELRKILQRLADVEGTIDSIRNAIRNMDTPMKKAQTRLDNRLQRHRVENCRDRPHFGLVEEVKIIADSVAALTAQLRQAQESQATLIKARSDLEREIMVKRKTLEIDRDRTALIRSHYPSANALSGY